MPLNIPLIPNILCLKYKFKLAETPIIIPPINDYNILYLY